jgi:alpha-L-rhamnosidase
MNSFNHYAFGAVGAWMYGYSLGIRRDEDAPGFKHFILQPEPDPTGSMTFARGHYESMYGRIESAWESLDSAVVYNFTVPSNTKATLILKAHSLEGIVIHLPHLHRDELIKFVEKEGGGALFLVFCPEPMKLR